MTNNRWTKGRILAAVLPDLKDIGFIRQGKSLVNTTGEIHCELEADTFAYAGDDEVSVDLEFRFSDVEYGTAESMKPHIVSLQVTGASVPQKTYKYFLKDGESYEESTLNHDVKLFGIDFLSKMRTRENYLKYLLGEIYTEKARTGIFRRRVVRHGDAIKALRALDLAVKCDDGSKIEKAKRILHNYLRAQTDQDDLQKVLAIYERCPHLTHEEIESMKG